MKSSRYPILVLFSLLAGLLFPVTTLGVAKRPLQTVRADGTFTLTGTMPTANALAVAPGTSVQMDFSRALDTASVTESTFTIYGSQTGTYNGARVFPTAESARFDPAANFKPGETIYVSASSGILSNSADPLDPAVVWQFEVGPGTTSESGTGIFDPYPSENHIWEDRNLTIGDLDGDGDLDALVDSEVWFGQGNGQFVKSGENLSGTFDRIPALGDVDGDGDLDAIIPSDTKYSPNRLWINDGSGSFSASGNDVGERGYNLAFADVDSDGDLDMFLASYSGGDVWFNNGLGDFAASGQSLGGNYTRNVFFRDFDGDADLDLLVGVWSEPKLYMNNGSGLFSLSPHALPSPDMPEDIAVGDLDADGDLDILAIKQWHGYMWRNDGSGKFSGQEVLNGALGNIQVLDLGDLDGDGDLDAILVSHDYTTIFRNNGKGSFSRDNHYIKHGASDLKLGDLDGDGDLDAIYGNSDEGLRGVYLNRDRMPPPTFWMETMQPPANDVSASLVDPLLVTFNEPVTASSLNSETVHVWGTFSSEYEHSIMPDDRQVTIQTQRNFKPGERITVVMTMEVESTGRAPLSGGVWQFTAEASAGSGRFYKSVQSITWPTYSFSLLADFDGDRDLDLLTTLCSESIRSVILMNNGSGRFKVNQRLNTKCGLGAAAGDLDGDGHLDLAIGGSGLWLNGGTGTFSHSSQEIPFARSIALGDVDADGDLDMVLAHDPPEGSEVWLNANNGNFYNSGQIIDGSYLVELGDLDADGDLDLVFAGVSSSIWINDSHGHFSREEESQSIPGSSDIALGDVDGDGDLDVLLASEVSPPFGTFLLLNNGQGVLNEKHRLTASSQSGVFADIDADEDLDVLLSGHGYTVFYVNDGLGNLTLSSSSVDWGGYGLTPGDLDEDGDLDFILGDSNEHKSLIFLNFGHQVFLPTVSGIGRP